MKLKKNIYCRNKAGWSLAETLVCILINSVIFSAFAFGFSSINKFSFSYMKNFSIQSKKQLVIENIENFISQNKTAELINYLNEQNDFISSYEIFDSQNSTPVSLKILFFDSEISLVFLFNDFIPGDIVL